MNRRQLLGVVGGLGVSLAGCLGRNDGSGQPTGSPTPSPPVESRVEVPPCPDKPDSLTRDNVVRYAVRFEKHHATRHVLRTHDRVAGVQFKTIAGVGDELRAEVSRIDGGFLVTFEVTLAYGWRANPGTPGTAIADLPQYEVAYFVTAKTVWRMKVTDDETPVDPRDHGTVVTCPAD